MSYCPLLFTDEVQKKIIKVWKIDRFNMSDTDSPLSRLLSSRNIELMACSRCSDVWLTCGKFIKKLIKEKILLVNSLCEQAVAVLRIEWDSVS